MTRPAAINARRLLVAAISSRTILFHREPRHKHQTVTYFSRRSSPSSQRLLIAIMYHSATSRSRSYRPRLATAAETDDWQWSPKDATEWTTVSISIPFRVRSYQTSTGKQRRPQITAHIMKNTVDGSLATHIGRPIEPSSRLTASRKPLSLS